MQVSILYLLKVERQFALQSKRETAFLEGPLKFPVSALQTSLLQVCSKINLTLDTQSDLFLSTHAENSIPRAVKKVDRVSGPCNARIKRAAPLKPDSSIQLGKPYDSAFLQLELASCFFLGIAPLALVLQRNIVAGMKRQQCSLSAEFREVEFFQ